MVTEKNWQTNCCNTIIYFEPNENCNHNERKQSAGIFSCFGCRSHLISSYLTMKIFLILCACAVVSSAPYSGILEQILKLEELLLKSEFVCKQDAHRLLHDRAHTDTPHKHVSTTQVRMHTHTHLLSLFLSLLHTKTEMQNRAREIEEMPEIWSNKTNHIHSLTHASSSLS